MALDGSDEHQRCSEDPYREWGCVDAAHPSP